MSRNFIARQGDDGYYYPYTSLDLVKDDEGKSASTKFEEINAQINNVEENKADKDEVAAQFQTVVTEQNNISKNNDNDCKFIAHRGGSTYAPENTMASFKMASKIGFWGCEVDIFPTLDNEWVVMHDETVDRTTNGTGYIKDLTLAQIKELVIDVGENLSEYPTQKVPTLEEFLLSCKLYNLIPVIEIKGGTNAQLDTLLNLLKKYYFENKAVIISFGLSILKYIRSKNKFIELHLVFNNDITQVIIDSVKDINNCHLSCSAPTKSNIELAHSYGMKVCRWTVNDLVRMKESVNNGVDYITSDAIGGLIEC